MLRRCCTAALVLLSLTACGGVADDVRSLLRESGSTVAAAPLGGRARADLVVLDGAAEVVVRAAELGGDLFRVTTTERAGVAPEIHVGRETVLVRLHSTGGGGPSAVTVFLAARVVWTLRLAGGASREVVDMSAGRVAGVALTAGAAQVELALPRPAGTVAVRMTAGAGLVTIRVPVGVPARVRLAAGAGRATIDGRVHTGLPAGAAFDPTGWEQAVDRYDIDAGAGVATLVLDHG